jgi:hypothetical protein
MYEMSNSYIVISMSFTTIAAVFAMFAFSALASTLKKWRATR